MIRKDMEFYYKLSLIDRMLCCLTRDPLYEINKYIIYLRKEEKYDKKNDKFSKALTLFYLAKKNKLGNKLGFKIPKNTVKEGLTIYHHGSIIINEKAKIGKNCVLHGNNCIGNKGNDDCAPIIGDNVDIGFGAIIIGNVKVGNDVIIGANAVVVKSIKENLVVGGIPAKNLR